MSEVIKVVAKGLLNNVDECVNVFHAVVPTGQDGEECANAGEEWVVAMFNSIKVAISNNWKLIAIATYFVEGAVDVLIREVSVTDVEGGNSVDMLPQQIAAVIIGGTANAAIKGKKFIAGIHEENNDGGVIREEMIDLLVDFANIWIGGWTGVLGGSLQGAVYSPTLSQAATLESAKVDTIFGTQRRRKQGVGS